MQKILLPIYLLASCITVSQPNTEVYLFEVNSDGGISNLENISKNKGYDSQPHFLDAKSLLYSSTRNDQTDILLYDLGTGMKKWLTDTPGGSEYSPLKIPGKNAISAIRLDKDGKQLLYSYDITTGESKVLLEGLKVGYHVWYTKNILVATVLIDNRMDLVVANLEDRTTTTYQKNVGRSLHKIPNSNLISYISKEKETWLIKTMNPITGATEEIIHMLPETEDMAWMLDGTILLTNGKEIAKYHPERDTQWGVFHRFVEKEINNITRLAFSPDQRYLALVSGESPDVVIQRQVESFNDGNLEAFVSCYSEDVLVQNFPSDTSYVGRKKMTENYRRFLANNPNTRVKVTKRIIIGNKVIDAETATVSGKTHKQAAIYEVNNGSISSMTFIHERKAQPEIEKIVQQQLDAYNARDIDGFMDTYSNDIKLYNFPNKLTSNGKDKMREGYGSFFETTPDLKCEIKNRIVVGNKVIDEEFITVNGSNFSAVAIYEVENGKIAKVTFLR